MQFQGVEPLLAVLRGVCVGFGSWWRYAQAALHFVGLFVEFVPFGFSGLFSFVGAILEFIVVVRAVVKELGIYLHEKFHGVINHAVNGSGPVVSDCFNRASRFTYLLQWPFEFSYNGANMIGKMVSTLSLTRLQKYSLFQK